MARLIDANELSEEIKSLSTTLTGRHTLIEHMDAFRSSVLRIIDEQPTAEPQRLKGEWILLEYDYFTCNVCGYMRLNGCDSGNEAREKLENKDYPKFCEHCGADMQQKRPTT